MDGDTAVGADTDPEDQFLMKLHASFGLASYDWAQERLTVRYDSFYTHQASGFYGPLHDEDGHSWTLAWSREWGEHWRLVGEWLRVVSRFPPRALLGEPPAQTAWQAQLALRYRFHLGW